LSGDEYDCDKAKSRERLQRALGGGDST
jgi:hypothetical protein